MKKKLYLASPYGFSKQTKKLLCEFINIFDDLNIEVFEPFKRTKNIVQREDNWAYDVAENNFHDLKKCDCIFAIVNGNPPDEGGVNIGDNDGITNEPLKTQPEPQEPEGDDNEQ